MSVQFSRHDLEKMRRRNVKTSDVYATIKSPDEVYEGVEHGTVVAVKKVKIFALAESLGGVESLIEHPSLMTHAGVPKEEREKVGITNNMVRLSVGIEDVEDLIADLKKAME